MTETPVGDDAADAAARLDCVAVVGGGRWGRILATTLVKDNRASNVVLASRHNAALLRAWIAGREPGLRSRVSLVNSVAALPARTQAVLVATRPATHHLLARHFLARRLPVLVEKPLLCGADELRSLARQAEDAGVTIGVDHEFLVAGWLEPLARAVAESAGELHQLAFVWHEQAETERHGEWKRTDLTVSTVQDLFPHIMSIVTAMLGEHALAVESVQWAGEPGRLAVRLAYGGVAIQCDLWREAPRAARSIRATGPRGEVVVDWLSEPVAILAGGGVVPVSRAGGTALSRALRLFCRQVQAPTADFPLSLSRAIPIIEATAAVHQEACRHGAGHASTSLWSAEDTEQATATIRTTIAARLEREGLVPDAQDRGAVDGHGRVILALAGAYGSYPFRPLGRVAEDLRVDRAVLARLAGMIGETPELRTIVTHGPASYYWNNTILPMESAGVFDDIVDRRFRFPYRVGIYPGITCMFRCSFCARVTGQRYDTALIDAGTEQLIRTVAEAPADDPRRFYISGGLEPLTNPRLGELITHARRRGFLIQCHTNAFALTPAALTRQPGLWDLDSLRVSLYGLAEGEYANTTQRRGAFGRVRENLKGLLRLRAEQGQPVRIGLNYVILPGSVDRLPGIIDYIADLNEAAPQRPVDFLTLREDYSTREQGQLSPAERAGLANALAGVRERAARMTGTLAIDYGYALAAALYGSVSALPPITHTDMAPTGYPQACVVVDVAGDVYLYREAGFPGLPGADRYIIGRVGPGHRFTDIVRCFVERGSGPAPVPGDERFLDAFDRVVTARLGQLRTDIDSGWYAQRGFLR
jgi:dTDP-4-amino-4,6-dideoxy-D-glucose ammonia-lyase